MVQPYNATQGNSPLYLNFRMGGKNLRVNDPTGQQVGLVIQTLIVCGDIDLSKGPVTFTVKDLQGTDAKDMGLKIQQKVRGSWKPAIFGPSGESKRQRAGRSALVNQQVAQIFQQIRPQIAATFEAQKDHERARERQDRRRASGELRLEVRAPHRGESDRDTEEDIRSSWLNEYGRPETEEQARSQLNQALKESKVTAGSYSSGSKSESTSTESD